MKLLTLLEVGDMTGVVIVIVGVIIIGALLLSLIVAGIAKLIYESKDNRKFSKKQFIQTMLISLLVCGLISGYICG
ncbi:hypothetical protein [uncultured Chryseobacterium sp.]|jgi:hypothetical protein|uniref:hypothetical protein n=1 Tax=uncultured Chryseobacterium sp. TaxID=259322 RepID=UPI002587470A|nr:hypothetical protein [uncultured Chryseobacterium sp.]